MVSSDYYDLIERTKAINRRLRNALFSRTDNLDDIRRIPFHGRLADGMPTESLGPFPEFILPTHPCNKTLAGFCSPCFFSKVAMSQKSREEIYDSLIVQTQFIIDHFDDIVIGFQCREDPLQSNWDITFCYACNGSFFSNAETTNTTRQIALKMLTDEIDRRCLKPLVYLETCVDDYLRFVESTEAKQIIPYLLKLNAVISFGFESSNDITRNLIYLKGLSLEDFEKAIFINQRIGLQSAAFIYTGFHSMTQKEIIKDVTDTVEYLTGKNVMPILMFPNLQEYTLPHLLYTGGHYNLTDPRTVLSIFKKTDEITSRQQITKRDYWLMGDLFGGPPAPPTNSFNNPHKCTCTDCSELVRSTLQRIRKNHDSKSLESCEKVLADCSCFAKYSEQISIEKGQVQSDRITRVFNTIEFAEGYCSEYLELMAGKGL